MRSTRYLVIPVNNGAVTGKRTSSDTPGGIASFSFYAVDLFLVTRLEPKRKKFNQSRICQKWPYLPEPRPKFSVVALKSIWTFSMLLIMPCFIIVAVCCVYWQLSYCVFLCSRVYVQWDLKTFGVLIQRNMDRVLDVGMCCLSLVSFCCFWFFCTIIMCAWMHGKHGVLCIFSICSNYQFWSSHMGSTLLQHECY